MFPNRNATERKIGDTSGEKMKEAVEQVVDGGKRIRNVCKTYDIKNTTLQRYVKKAPTTKDKDSVKYEPTYNCRKVFSKDEEILLHDYLIKASKILHGLTRQQVRELAYNLAVKKW